jgi:predicted enzyme related to lactoylglutathione lyase
MPRRTDRWPAGTPCWADLTTTDLSGARAFYAELLGWSFTDTGAEFGGYLLCDVDGAATAGMGAVQREGEAVAWTLYFATDDVDATAAAVTAAGGTVVAPVMDVGTLGRMVIAADPAGAVFGAWQPLDFIGAAWHHESGGLAWEDLRSADPDAARAFYGGVFGFDFEPLPMAGPDYATFRLAGTGVESALGGLGGMMGMEGFPSHWIVYFAVAHVDTAVADIERLGGHILSPGFDTPYGRMAAVTDPWGASFWIVEMPAPTA